LKTDFKLASLFFLALREQDMSW